MGGTRKGNERGLVWSAEDLPVLAWSQLASLWQLTLVVEPNRNTVKILYLVIYKDWVQLGYFRHSNQDVKVQEEGFV